MGRGVYPSWLAQGGGSGIIFVFVFLICFGKDLRGASFQDRSIAEMTMDSEMVFRVRILSEGNMIHQKMPFNEVQAQVLETFKGEPKERIQFHVPGGRLNGKRLLFSGAPNFLPGREYIVFLSRVAESQSMHRLDSWESLLVVSSPERDSERLVLRVRNQEPHREKERLHDHTHGQQSEVYSLQSSPFQRYDDVVTEIFSAQ